MEQNFALTAAPAALTPSAPAMIDTRLRYVYAIPDRHGNPRLYFWRGKSTPKIRIREAKGSPEFHTRYAELMAGVLQPKPGPSVERPKEKTFRWLCVLWMRSPEFIHRLKPRTQYGRRRTIESMCQEPIYHGSTKTFADFPLEKLKTEHLEILRDRKAKFPEAADDRVKALRALFDYAKGKRLAANLALEVKYLRVPSDGYHTMTPEELTTFEQCHPVGTTARLAVDLLQYTGAARVDVIAIGPKNIMERKSRGKVVKVLTYRRGKTGVGVEITLPSALAETIAASPVIGTTTFLTNALGRPFTADNFTANMRKWCDAAGLPECSAHTIRKAAATRAAENGATAHQLMAMFGWMTLKEAERYTRAAQRKKLASGAATFLKK